MPPNHGNRQLIWWQPNGHEDLRQMEGCLQSDGAFDAT